jgi:hypothetical protein
MMRVRICGAALLLAVAASARAGIEPYPQAVQVEDAPARTRAQVVAGLQEAIREGRITYGEGDNAVRAPIQAQSIADGFSYLVDLASGRSHDPEQAAVAQSGDAVVVWGERSVPSAQVRAETLEAARLGLLANREDGNFPTTEQLEMIAAAGVRALTAGSIVGSR